MEWQAWYLDDAIILGQPSQLHDALTTIVSMAALIGIEVNLSKCCLWGLAALITVPAHSPINRVPVVPYTADSGIKVLGIPICHPEADTFAATVWSKRLRDLDRTLKVLAVLPQAHLQYTLLRYCLSE